MGSGIVQLASVGRQDRLFYKSPEITFFKTMYKRHTDFASQSMPQHFSIKPDFGKNVSCTVANIGDLLGAGYMCIELPPIGSFHDVITDTGSGNSQIACCAWVKKIGFRLIESISFQFNDKTVEIQTHDWLNIYDELYRDENMSLALNEMIGDIDELTDFTPSKRGYKLIIPLQFWFNRFSSMAFPIVAAYNTTIKINVKFSSLEDCLILGPTHYMVTDDDICLFEKGDIIYQNINGVQHSGKFIFHDPIDKKMYYIKITKESFKNGYYLYKKGNINYNMLPNSEEKLYLNKKKYFGSVTNLALGKTYLWLDYIFLETRERNKFLENPLEYIIDVMQYDSEYTIYQATDTIAINHSYPCKEIIFTCCNEYMYNGYLKDKYNYYNDVERTEDLVLKGLLTINSQERLEEQDFTFYEKRQPLKYHKRSGTGIGVYSFGSKVDDYQFSGYCNLSEIANMELRLRLNKSVSATRPIQLRLYTVVLKKLTIKNGIVDIN